MPTSCTHVYVHFVWGTWDRAPWITPAVEARLHACIAEECRRLKCDPRAINGTEDHVHAVVRLHPTVAVAELAKQMKGVSSHLATHELLPDQGFKWQGSYGAFSVSPDRLPEVQAYVRRQKEHHALGTTVPDWERCMEED